MTLTPSDKDASELHAKRHHGFDAAPKAPATPQMRWSRWATAAAPRRIGIGSRIAVSDAIAAAAIGRIRIGSGISVGAGATAGRGVAGRIGLGTGIRIGDAGAAAGSGATSATASGLIRRVRIGDRGATAAAAGGIGIGPAVRIGLKGSRRSSKHDKRSAAGDRPAGDPSKERTAAQLTRGLHETSPPKTTRTKRVAYQTLSLSATIQISAWPAAGVFRPLVRTQC